jgi:hypothetical protein
MTQELLNDNESAAADADGDVGSAGTGGADETLDSNAEAASDEVAGGDAEDDPEEKES